MTNIMNLSRTVEKKLALKKSESISSEKLRVDFGLPVLEHGNYLRNRLTFVENKAMYLSCETKTKFFEAG